MNPHDRLADQFLQVIGQKPDHPPLIDQFREVYRSHQFSETCQVYEMNHNQKRTKQFVVFKKVLYPATAAAVAAMIMTPSVVAFAERDNGDVIPGEKLPVQVQTENSAIEQPTDQQPKSEQRSVPRHPVVPQERSDVPRTQIEVGGEKDEHHKAREHRKERFYESRQQEKPEQRVAPKASETITTPSKPVTPSSEPATQTQPSSSVSQPKQQSRPSDENRHQESSRPQDKPESSAVVQSDTEQKPAASQKQQDQSTASTSQATKAKVSTPTPAAPQGQVQDQPTASDQLTDPASQTVETKVSTETSAAQPGSASPASRIEVKGKLPETASPYPVQMLSSLGITVAGLVGLKWSKRKNPR